MKSITENEIYLPAIQRKFVWNTEKIEKLFDSIMRGYPIGTFLFWMVKDKAKRDYTFYKFIQDYHQRDRAWNQVAPKPDLREQFIGVLDGQQRLNSMYVALQGSYAYRRKHGRWNDDDAFPQRFLHLNLFFNPSAEEESEIVYEFSFLTTKEASAVSRSKFWFKVKDILAWPNTSPVFKYIEAQAKEHPDLHDRLRERGAEILTLLWQRLCSDDVLNYFAIQEQVLDNIVDIFVRVNSAGIPLSKTDLLFSSIVAHWDSGREEIEATIQTLNEKGNGFSFNNDFMMRTCLALADLPVRLKVNSFKKQNIEAIKANWDGIESALDATADLLVEWGFSGQTIPALNAVIPIAYFIHKNGNLPKSKDALRQFLIRAQVKQIFSSTSDRVLGRIRETLRKTRDKGKSYELTDKVFALAQLTQIPEFRSLLITEEDFQDFLDEPKGAYSFMLLSLLYPHLKFEQIQFHQDHIHPRSQFTRKKLNDIGLGDEAVTALLENCDKLPNLQLMEGLENKKKNATPFSKWIESLGKTKSHFLRTNFISPKSNLEIACFERFFAQRRELLREKLMEIFQ